MKKSEYLLKSFINAAGAFLYVSAVAWGMFNGSRIFGEEQSFLIPLFMLLLLIFSAALTGFLVVGKPILLYIDGKKREAVILFSATIGWIAVFLAVIGTALLVR